MRLRELFGAIRRMPELFGAVRRNRELSEKIQGLEEEVDRLVKTLCRTDMKQARLRDYESIVRAFAIMKAMMDGGLDGVRIETDNPLVFHIVSDTLCWVMNHKHPTMLAMQLASFEAFLVHSGVKFETGVLDEEDVDGVDISALLNILKGDHHGRESSDNAPQ